MNNNTHYFKKNSAKIPLLLVRSTVNGGLYWESDLIEIFMYTSQHKNIMLWLIDLHMTCEPVYHQFVRFQGSTFRPSNISRDPLKLFILGYTIEIVSPKSG